MFGLAKKFAKMQFDRRTFSGSSEFSIWPKFPTRESLRIEIVARDQSFQTTVVLRRGTSDLAAFEQIFIDNCYNLRRFARWNDIYECYHTILRTRIPIILDLGANIGLSSLYFAKNWPQSHIIAVEPSDENFRSMRDNVKSFSNIQQVRAAVSSNDGTVRITNPEAQSWAYKTASAPTGSSGGIDAYSVERLLHMAPNSARYSPFIAKIDIEGFENNLFSENTDWVKNFPLVVIELHDWMMPRQGNSASFLRTISQCDRDFVIYGENIFSISNAL
jgi:FkbM family methyltransferase